jgi:hypothetical protein
MINKTVLFVTAYKDINRKNWPGFTRTTDTYIEWFGNLQKNPIRLICFCDDYIKKSLETKYGFNCCYPYDEENTFFKDIDIHKQIINSDDYRQLAINRKDPECIYPEYNIVNHNKVIFLKRAKNMFPHYTHYAWIDFGHCRSEQYIYKIFDFNNLPETQIHIGSAVSYINPDYIPNPRENIVRNLEIFRGSPIFVPSSIIDKICDEYISVLELFKCNNVVDDDQSVFLQIYKKNPDLFLLHKSGWFELFTFYATDQSIDAVIPTCEKDIGTCNMVILKLRKHVKYIRNIYVVCKSSLFSYVNDAICIDENMFPFKLSDFECLRYIRNKEWFYQQFLKLHIFNIIPNLSQNCLICDSETIFYNDYDFFKTGKPNYFISNEVRTFYRSYTHSLFPQIKYFPNYSGITHCMLFQQHVINHFFDLIYENYPDCEVWKTLLKLHSGNCILSEYDSYLLFIINFYEQKILINNDDIWDLSNVIPHESPCIYLTCHAHMRGQSYKQLEYRIDNNALI